MRNIFKVLFVLLLISLNIAALVNSFNTTDIEEQEAKKSQTIRLPEAQTLVLPSLLKF